MPFLENIHTFFIQTEHFKASALDLLFTHFSSTPMNNFPRCEAQFIIIIILFIIILFFKRKNKNKNKNCLFTPLVITEPG